MARSDKFRRDEATFAEKRYLCRATPTALPGKPEPPAASVKTSNPMDTKTYLRRSAKYLVWLIFLFALLFALMLATNTSRVEADRMFDELFGSVRGAVMGAVIVVLAALYPKFGFTRRYVQGDLVKDRERILHVFASGGYSLVSEEEGTLVFRFSSPVRRLLAQGEDKIVVSEEDGRIVLDGIRKEAVKAEFRLKSFLGQ